MLAILKKKTYIKCRINPVIVMDSFFLEKTMKYEDQVLVSLFVFFRYLDYGVTHRSVLQMRKVEHTPTVSAEDSQKPLGAEALISEKELVFYSRSK